MKNLERNRERAEATQKMRILLFVSLLCSAFAQEDVQVSCDPDQMEIRITKALVNTNGFSGADVHLKDSGCVFGESEDEQYYTYSISPLTACNTDLKLNTTHVEYKNKLVAGSESAIVEKGSVIVGTQGNPERSGLSAKLRCVFPVELMVSTAFLPNISHVTIPLPDVFGTGSFMASMSLFKTANYAEAYVSNPKLSTGDALFVGVQLLGKVTDDIYLRMERCWATPIADSDSEIRFPLIENGCSDEYATSQGLAVSVNGDETFGRFEVPVFKFVAYSAVWLHCDLQICIAEPCQPTCNARKRRSTSKNGYGPEDWEESHLISLGPIARDGNVPEVIIEEVEEVDYENFNEEAEKPLFTPFHVAVLSALIAVSALCVTLACFLCRKPSKQ